MASSVRKRRGCSSSSSQASREESPRGPISEPPARRQIIPGSEAASNAGFRGTVGISVCGRA
jgi:hypothetical protein